MTQILILVTLSCLILGSYINSGVAGIVLERINDSYRKNVIIDTDAGVDDIIAISYLLTRSEINIQAIAIVHGLANVENGYQNIKCLLHSINRLDIPVFAGESVSLLNKRTFPESWRDAIDTVFQDLHICNNQLTSHNTMNEITAVDYLIQRIMDRENSFTLLALGPLTNVALALQTIHSQSNQSTSNYPSIIQSAIDEIVIMGGAFEVTGNIKYDDVDSFNPHAEWNIFCDPEAANLYTTMSSYFTFSTIWIGLDATNYVPVTPQDMKILQRYYDTNQLNLLGEIAMKSLYLNIEHINNNEYYAWDPLAAVYLTHSDVIFTRPADQIQILLQPPYVGNTRVIQWTDDKINNNHICINQKMNRFNEENDIIDQDSTYDTSEYTELNCNNNEGFNLESKKYIAMTANQTLFNELMYSTFLK